MEREFYSMARQIGCAAVLETRFVPQALQALKAGDSVTHDRLVAEAAKLFRDPDSILLAQFSNARAAQAVSQVVDVPILTSPTSAVVELKQILGSAAKSILSERP
jgi:hypothetical protein